MILTLKVWSQYVDPPNPEKSSSLFYGTWLKHYLALPKISWIFKNNFKIISIKLLISSK